MGNEFEKAVKRFSEAKDVLEKFEKSEEAVAFMQNGIDRRRMHEGL